MFEQKKYNRGYFKLHEWRLAAGTDWTWLQMGFKRRNLGTSSVAIVLEQGG